MFTVCLVILAAAGSAVGTAAENAAPTQDLVNPKALENVVDARWTRQPDAYVLRVVLDTAKPVRSAMSARLSPLRRAPTVNAAEAQQPPPQRAPPQPRTPVNQPYAQAIREPRVEAWLLKADGTQIMPATYICDPGPRDPDAKFKYDISYGFTAADGAQAVAAAIRVDGDFFIEVLQPLEPQPAPR